LLHFRLDNGFCFSSTLAKRKVATDELKVKDPDIIIADNGILIKKINHQKIHKIGS
jgi:hypothetical protein